MEPSTTDLSIISESENTCSRFFKNFSNSKASVEKTKSKNEKLDEIFKYFQDKLEKLKESKATTNAKEDKKNIDELIKKGWDVNFKTKKDDNALHLIAEVKPNEDSVILYKYLIGKGCEFIENYYGINVLHSAALSDNEHLIKHLFKTHRKENEFLNSKTFGGFQTPLHLAAKVGANNAILCLIENGADKEAKDYLGRTPLYLAAEYGHEETVKLFIEKGCKVNVVSKNGQKALFWIVAKCRNLAPDILDTYRILDKYNFKDTYYLKAVELELIKEDKDINTDELEKDTNDKTEIPKVKSILEHIVGHYDLELITHPVIKKLIEYKWKRYRFWSFFKFFIDLLFSVIWNLWSVLIPYHERHIYNLPKDTWRIIVFILGIISIFLILIVEIKEVYDEHNYKKKIRKARLKEVLDEGAKVHPKDVTQNKYLENEEILCKNKSSFFKLKYFSDGWNLLDILSIILLTTSLATHLADIVNHSERIARNHIRVTSITVVVLSFRLLKTARVLWKPFGRLVMTLYFIVKDIVVWATVFIIILLPFTTCFYILYGNGLTVGCDSQTCSAENKTVVSGMENYNKALFFLYTATFGAGDFPYEQYTELDDQITDFLIGFYIGATTLILLNIFIAMLSSTFERVHDTSKGIFLIERAKEIIQLELSLPEKWRIEKIKTLRKQKKVSTYSPKDIRDEATSLKPLIESLNILNKKYENMNIIFKKIDVSVEKLIKLQEDMMKQKFSQSNKSQIDVLYFSENENDANV